MKVSNTRHCASWRFRPENAEHIRTKQDSRRRESAVITLVAPACQKLRA